MPFISASAISLYNSIRGGAEGGLVPAGLLLDLYPNAEIALDFFKLRTDYNGNCIRVRRPSDDAQLDIGFVDNYIDTASLLTFAGAEDVFIVKRYDQSGNGNDTFVDAVDNQPKIVNAGVLVTEGGIAMGDWDGTNDYLATAAGLNFGTSARSIFTVQKADTIAVSAIVNLASNSTAGGAWLVSPEVGVRAVAQGWISSTPISTNNISLLSNIYIGGDIHSGNSMWIDGSSVTRTSGNDGAINTENTVLSEGAQSSAGNAFDGRKGTLIVYKSDQTANRTAIENIINSNYKIYWDGSQTGLLDDYPNASAAYSLRALSSAYTGPAIEVRKTVGGATSIKDIGFLYDGSLDTASLLSFAGSDDVFVTKWYDQSGAGNDAFQISQSSQASIVLSGVLNTTNGNVAALGTSNTVYVTGYSIFSGADGTYSGFVVSKLISAFDGVMQLNNLSSGGGGEIFRYFNTSSTTFRVQSWDSGGGAPVLVTEPINANSNAISSFIRRLDSLTTSLNSLTNSLLGLGEPRKNIEDRLTIMGSSVAGFGLESYFSEAILYPSDQTANRAGIEANINKNYNIYWDGSQTGLLDDYPNAAAAYSLRALNSAYTGPAIEVRKTVGGVTSKLDIGFRYDGSLDTASLLSFADGGDVFVAKWYDQSGGNFKDVSQVSDAFQPQIVSSGVINTLNGFPALYSDGTKVLQTTSTNISVADVNGNKSAFGTLNVSTDGLLVSYIDGGANLLYPIGHFASFGGIGINLGGGFSDAVPYTFNNNCVFSSIVSNANVEVWNNNVSDGGAARGVITLGGTQISLFARNSSGLLINGYSNEIILYPFDQSANRLAIESNINKNYNIYWDGSQNGILDDYPNASAAYSLRALNSAYTGPAIEARKTVGGVTSKLDINFLYDGSLDTESLLSFADGGDVFVAKWYDQSGGGNNDVAQVSESAQPQIVSSGVVVTTSDNYAIDFSGSTKTLVNETFDNSTQVSSVFTIVKSTSLIPQVITDSADLANRQVSGFYAGNPVTFAISKGISIKSATPTNTNMNLLSTFFDVNSDLYLNGAKIINSANAGSNTRQGFTLGSGVGGAASFEGSIFEVIVFDEQNKSSDRVEIETNINNHYTIYP